MADQLREIREDAGLTGRRLAELAGWHGVSKVSKIEHAVRPITAADLRVWCRVCGVPVDREQELLAELRDVAGMWVSYKQLNRGGLKRAQESVREEYERARLMRAYQTKVIPGLLQTAAYTTAALTQVRIEQGVDVDDVAAAVAERMDRQGCLRRRDARFLFVLEEDVLWYRPYSDAVQVEQLRHLLETMRRPSVSLGIIPRMVHRRGVAPDESFDITDEESVTVELVSGYLTITNPSEIAMYLRAWDRLHSLAVVGEPARRLIQQALEALPNE
ncbi:Scr1 family TA system antitoxin-like transcriptional regulator [Nonomuraea guangzhouensis]|uniref:Scr1 family TA system antitoxin-like transcriptional regulator n=1 Tax=Nonomuraea guangzhouensis TaxID=1291555 RepID=A0ABW4GY34_9ACTN|nr:Scr1 family TA system antitoxin-like transcriptional regulator [Nonomuraea guangzhouensis]